MYTIAVKPARARSPSATISKTPKNGSERHQNAAANQKLPAAVKQPTFTHPANFQFTTSSTMPTTGRITSTTNSKHNWKSNSAGNPTLRSLVNINQDTQTFAVKTQARRMILFIAWVESSEGAPSINEKRFRLSIKDGSLREKSY